MNRTKNNTNYLSNSQIATMKQEGLNHVTVLHVHQDRLDSVDSQKVQEDFVLANEYRRTAFGHIGQNA